LKADESTAFLKEVSVPMIFFPSKVKKMGFAFFRIYKGKGSSSSSFLSIEEKDRLKLEDSNLPLYYY